MEVDMSSHYLNDNGTPFALKKFHALQSACQDPAYRKAFCCPQLPSSKVNWLEAMGVSFILTEIPGRICYSIKANL
jgi:hypothetical protein